MTSVMTRGLSAAALAAALCAFDRRCRAGPGSPLSVLDRMFGNRPQAPVQQQATGQEPIPDQVVRIERLEAQIRQHDRPTIEQLQYRNQQLEAQIRGMGGNTGGAPRAAGPGRPCRPAPSRADGPAASADPAGRGRRLQPGVPPAAACGRCRAAAPTCSIRRRIRTRPARRRRSAASPRRAARSRRRSSPPSRRSARPAAAARARRSTFRRWRPALRRDTGGDAARSPPGGALPPPPSRNLSATGAVAAVAPPAEQPKDYYDLGYGYVLRKDYALAEQTFDTFLKKFPERPPRRRRAVLARRKPVPAPAL